MTAAPLSGAETIRLLDQTIDWYRTLGIEQQAADEPSDELILFDNRQTAGRVIATAFEIARANARILAEQPAPDDAAASSALPSAATLLPLQNKFAAQRDAVQVELAAKQRQLATERGARATDLKAKIAELQGELDLVAARLSLLATFASLADENQARLSSNTALKAQIDAMAVTVPSSNGGAAAPGTAVPGTAAPAASGAFAGAGAPAAGAATQVAGSRVTLVTRFGIWDLVENVFKLSAKIATVDSLDVRTQALQGTFTKMREPLIARLKALSAQGDALATQADGANAAALTQTREQLDGIADQFKQIAALLIPLGKEDVLLGQYRRNLGNWRDIVDGEYRGAVKTLGVRLAILLALLALVFAAAELWRSAVTRYIHDARRRYQFLLLRRIALWCLVIIIIGFAFASELGSIVTFAGLITAGLAVAMQSVLVSIVGYFFLIGKYGIRIGDRVQIGDVYGEVIELGLVRLHLMELGGHGLLGPTGRVVAFANSIVFQVASGLFKQIPGVDFAWHEITLTLPPGVDYAGTKEKLLVAATAALEDSREEIARQTREIQRTSASSAAGDAQPRVQLSYTAAGVEARIRYPVHLRNAAEIDERVSQQVMGVVTALAPLAAAPVAT